jgi:chorismate--pyruvate lyase
LAHTEFKRRRILDFSLPMHQPERIKWSSHQRLQRAMPSNLAACVQDRASLTARLTEAGQGQFRVQLLSQGWQMPTRDDRLILGLADRQMAQVRTVLLYCGEQPRVYARSVIPAGTLAGKGIQLKRLQNRSLGAWLYASPEVQRSAFEVACFPPDNRYVPANFQGSSTLWGRRSRFDTASGALLVSEIFLPEFQPYPIVSRHEFK